jgi:hypothetical protein
VAGTEEVAGTGQDRAGEVAGTECDDRVEEVVDRIAQEANGSDLKWATGIDPEVHERDLVSNGIAHFVLGCSRHGPPLK